MNNKVNKNHPFFDRFEQLMAEKEKKGLGIRAAAIHISTTKSTKAFLQKIEQKIAVKLLRA